MKNLRLVLHHNDATVFYKRILKNFVGIFKVFWIFIQKMISETNRMDLKRKLNGGNNKYKCGKY